MHLFISRLALGAGLVFGIGAQCAGAAQQTDPGDPAAAVLALEAGTILAGYRTFIETDEAPPMQWRKLNDALAAGHAAMHGGMAPLASEQPAGHGDAAATRSEESRHVQPAMDHAAMGHAIAPTANHP